MNTNSMRGIFILFLFITSSLATAQSRYAGQSVIGFQGGVTGKKGYFADINYQRLIGNSSWSFKVDAIFANQSALINDVPLDEKVNLKHFLVLPGALYTFENMEFGGIYFSVFGGGVAGYEIVNDGNTLLSNSGLHAENLKNTFIYGAHAGAMVEAEISRTVVFYGSGTEIYRRNSQVGEFTFYVGLGLRFYF